MPNLRDRNFEATLEALIQYAVDGGGYTFGSGGADGNFVISISVEDEPAYTRKYVTVLAEMPPVE